MVMMTHETLTLTLEPGPSLGYGLEPNVSLAVGNIGAGYVP